MKKIENLSQAELYRVQNRTEDKYEIRKHRMTAMRNALHSRMRPESKSEVHKMWHLQTPLNNLKIGKSSPKFLEGDTMHCFM